MSAKKKRQNDSSLHLTDKRHPVMGIIAVLIGVLSAIAFIWLCFLSSESHGKAGKLIGFGGLLCFFVSTAGFVMSWLSLKQDNIRPLFPTIAAIINGLSMVFYFLLYLWGNLM